MPRKKKEEIITESVETTAEVAPAKKPGLKLRAKKPEAPATAASTAAPAEKPKRSRAPRVPRKKKIVPHFVIQNSVDNGITYEAIVEKVQTAIGTADVNSIDIYVKAEEGKAYYVCNGEIAGAVDLF